MKPCNIPDFAPVVAPRIQAGPNEVPVAKNDMSRAVLLEMAIAADNQVGGWSSRAVLRLETNASNSQAYQRHQRWNVSAAASYFRPAANPASST